MDILNDNNVRTETITLFALSARKWWCIAIFSLLIQGISRAFRSPAGRRNALIRAVFLGLPACARVNALLTHRRLSAACPFSARRIPIFGSQFSGECHGARRSRLLFIISYLLQIVNVSWRIVVSVRIFVASRKTKGPHTGAARGGSFVPRGKISLRCQSSRACRCAQIRRCPPGSG